MTLRAFGAGRSIRKGIFLDEDLDAAFVAGHKHRKVYRLNRNVIIIFPKLKIRVGSIELDFLEGEVFVVEQDVGRSAVLCVGDVGLLDMVLEVGDLLLGNYVVGRFWPFVREVRLEILRALNCLMARLLGKRVSRAL